MSNEIQNTTERIAEQSKRIDRLRHEIGKAIIGQEPLIDRMLIALIADGHILLEGVPGLAKTLAVRSLSEALGLSFHRISFTPDLLPADVIGTLVYNPREAVFEPRQGPVFTNLLLADEINRAPAKVQSALLEAMQERQVTIGDTSYRLPSPFLVLATQNPIEQEGTYPLPEAQVDRFMFKCRVKYPSRDDERRIMQRFTRLKGAAAIEPVLSAEDIEQLRAVLDAVYCDEKVGEYILDIVFATRDPERFKVPAVGHIEMGASPRATLFLHTAARAHAMLQGRAYATPQDVKDVAHDVLRHRVLLTYEAEAEGLDSDLVIARILETLPVP